MSNTSKPASNQPKEYQDGWTEFLNCKIDLSKRPLIPRPETEYWLEQALQMIGHRMSNHLGGMRALDIFAGSGCIGVALARKYPALHLTFADNDPTMLEQVKINCDLNKLNSKSYTLIQSDIFSAMPGTYDFIFANPPYVPVGQGVGRPTSDGVNIMDHEPKEALYAGKEGLDVIMPFFEQVREHLNPGGQIWLEFGAEQKDAITNILRELNYYGDYNCAFHKDQHGAWRYVVLAGNT